MLLLFGAKKIPELARGLGKSMGEFKKARDEFEREIMTAESEAMDDEPKKKKKVEEAETVEKETVAPAESQSRES